MNRSRNTIALLTLSLPLLVLSLLGCDGRAPEETAREVARNVRVMPLETGDVVEFLEVAGPVLPVRGTDISAEESGTVQQIVKDKGTKVDRDQPVVRLDASLLSAELSAAEANLKLQQYNYEKTDQLYKAGKISRLELLQAEASYESARGQRDISRTRHDRCQVTAPFDGVVVDRYVEPGQLVSPGMPVARIIDPYVLKLEGSLTESEVAWVKSGMNARVTLEGVSEPAAGKVAWVGFEASQRNGKFPVEINIDNSDLRYRSGVIGRASLPKRTTSAMVVIPRDAVMPERGVNHVYIIEDDRAIKRRVELGPRQGLMVAVQDGLEAGDLLVVRGQRELRDGSLVVITERVAFGDGTVQSDPDVIKSSSAATRVTGEVTR